LGEEQLELEQVEIFNKAKRMKNTPKAMNHHCST
jgi:hypothetical protein